MDNSEFVSEFIITGNCVINVDKCIEKWNHLWWVYEGTVWDYDKVKANIPLDKKYSLQKYLRWDSGITTLKVGISNEQAEELIEKLGMEKQRIMGSAFSWRRPKDNIELDKRRNKKLGIK